MRALVTGGSGYFGSLLLRKLRALGHDCAVLDIVDADDRPADVRFFRADIRDAARAKRFYQDILGLEVVWEPDPQNVYLSSGWDNLAIHEVSEAFLQTAEEKQLDHLGFLVDSIERVRTLEAEFRSHHVTIVHPFKVHRDGSASFYCADPDGIVIQILYEPALSRQTIR